MTRRWERRLKICILRIGQVRSHCGFEITVFGEFCGVLVYGLTFNEKLRKKRLARAMRKGVLWLSAKGVALFGAPSSLGIAGTVSERELLLDLRARFAESFLENIDETVDVQLCGGSFRRRIDAALSLLERRRTVYLSCADFEETAEEITALTGATVGEFPRGKVIEVNLSEGDEILRFGEKRITLSDFSISLPWKNAEELSAEEILTLAAMLELCGGLQKKEIIVECFVK